jgi:hypothetical protein
VSSKKCLIVGGLNIAGYRGTVAIEQFPFTFEGISKAYQRLPQQDVLVLFLDRHLLEVTPSSADILRFTSDASQYGDTSPLHPLPVELGLITASSHETVEQQISASVEALSAAPAALQNLTEHAARLFLRHLVESALPVLDDGGSVVFFIDDSYHEWSEKEQSIVGAVLPGLRAHRDQRWSERAAGEEDLLRAMGDYRSSIALTWDADGDNAVGLFHSEVVPEEIPVTLLPGIHDRRGKHRVLHLRVGTGNIYICPASLWPGILRHLGIDCELGEGLACEEPLQAAAPLVKDTRLGDMLPDDLNELKGWNVALGWGKPDNRSTGFRSAAEIAAVLDALQQNKDRDPAKKIEIPGTPRTTTGGAMLRMIKRKREAIGSEPAALITFLGAAEAQQKRVFRSA